MAKLNPQQKLIGAADLTVSDFWAWGFSNILTNTTRSVFAEFLVATALGVIDVPRVEWDAVDLRYSGKKIEVKAAAYLQAWKQKTLSAIRFDIAEKHGWDAETSVTSEQALRSADCYVFCLFAERDAAKANVLDVSQWQFFALATHQLQNNLAQQKSIGLARLQSLCKSVTYAALQQEIEQVLGL